MKRFRTVAAAVGVGVVASLVLAAVPASAAHIKTHVVVTQGGTEVTAPISVVNGSPSPTVSVTLDDGCLNAFDHGQTFGFAASSDNDGVATVSPAMTSGLQCGDSSVFTITGHSNGTATLHFDVVATKGLEGQTAGKSVTADVTGFPTDGGSNPPGHERPAAPAVANSYVHTYDTVSAGCAAAYGGAHSWHGHLIRDVAHWAAANHLGKLKDDTTMFPTDESWVTYVTDKVDELCS